MRLEQSLLYKPLVSTKLAQDALSDDVQTQAKRSAAQDTAVRAYSSDSINTDEVNLSNSAQELTQTWHTHKPDKTEPAAARLAVKDADKAEQLRRVRIAELQQLARTDKLTAISQQHVVDVAQSLLEEAQVF